jgi:5-methylthioribose kinase
MTLPEQFTAHAPGAFFLDERLSPDLTQLLTKNGWLAPGETMLSLEKPGEGNMNVVMRVTTDRRAFILKQARPWVAKYPQVAAPMARIAVEARFYEQATQNQKLAPFMPTLIGFDADHFLLALEDLGAGSDFTFLYQPGQQIADDELVDLTQFMSALHQIRATDAGATFPDNRAMRLLNHEHMFSFPFRHDTGFDLDTVQPGLQTLSIPYKNDEVLKAKIARLGERYLQPGRATAGSGSVLIHGDYYPGSWLKTATGTRVIDPEFGFFGPPEFDFGVMLAHLKLARQPESVQQQTWQTYQPPADFDATLARAFAGVEILRRLLGLAQLPLPLGLDEKKTLLEEATGLVLPYDN